MLNIGVKLSRFPIALAGMLFVASFALVKPAKADEWNQRTVVQFSAPVELPGVALPAGTYVFRLMDFPSDRNIVQVFDKDEKHLYATLLTVPEYREPAGKTAIRFDERPAGTPEAIRSWLYPGDSYAHEMIYPHAQKKAPNGSVAAIPPAGTQQPVE
jgi:hypothetical protein